MRMKKRMDSDNKREKYLRVRTNEVELKEFDIACSQMQMNRSDLIRQAILEFLGKENIEIWKN